jgi:hypothetical protein
MQVIAIYRARIDPANVDRLLPDSAAVEATDRADAVGVEADDTLAVASVERVESTANQPRQRRGGFSLANRSALDADPHRRPE